MKNTFLNESCFDTMNRMPSSSVDVILTSPPYNMTKRKGGYADKGLRYDEYKDWKSEKEYIDWIVSVFLSFEKILSKNGVILFNFSYSIENPSLPYLLVSSIIEKTGFRVVDTIVWKKPTAIPHPASYNRLNRIVEFVYVFSRASETKTFRCNKPIKRISPTGQKYYEVVNNFINAKNNDGSNPVNKATFSTDFCDKLLGIYGGEGLTVYDPFMGTGTTAVSAIRNKMSFVGSEISKKQVEYSNQRMIANGLFF